jgi:hypothetical protein
MNTPRQPRLEPPPMRRSAKVALVLLGTAGVVGVGALAFDSWRRARDEDAPPPAPQPPAPPISATQTYPNNDFIPGVGYYHAPYHGWFPFPFNYHDPSRGYYGGGLWQAAPFIANLLSSRPTEQSVAAALAARRAREEAERQQRAQSSSSGYTSNFRGSSGGGSYSASRPASSPAPASGSHSIQRGGFGSSGHSSGGSS